MKKQTQHHANTEQSPFMATDIDDFLLDIDDQVKQFESDEKSRLNLRSDSTAHWYDANPTEFTAAQRQHTTILFAGLTMAHDFFIQSAFRGLGYKVEAMDVPDNRALQFGREFGNRGQCNPTYFTVGNLVKKLKALEATGLSRTEIIKHYIFATAGSCGPCRFGTYVTEYRKALRDAGFEGFRVILFQQSGGVKQATGSNLGLQFNLRFFVTIGKAIILGDVLNALMYRIRPFEVEKGVTDKVVERAKQRIAQAFETGKGLIAALWQTRRELAQIKVDRSQVKPRVAIIGEFWAMTTEGDGNYRMQQFLEQQGAEVDIQLVVNWVLYLLWAAKYDTLDRARLKDLDRGTRHGVNGSKFALENVNVKKKLLMLTVAEKAIRGLFYFYAKVLGLRQFHLPDMEHIAKISHAFYDNNLRGGEGHMEVGKLIHNVVDQKVNMTLSIKPFGCMPSSAVSDGVQSLITELYPNAIFLPIETNGDGAVNVYSRVQMQLFKAKNAARNEVATLLAQQGWSVEQFRAKIQVSTALQSGLYRSKHYGGSTTYDLLGDIVNRESGLWIRLAAGMKRFVEAFAVPERAALLEKVNQAAVRHRQRLQSRTDDMVVKIVEPT